MRLRSLLAAFAVSACLPFFSSAQTPGALLRSTPEAEGVSSDGILRFLDSAAAGRTQFHSFMMLRHGKVIAEGWWNPYRAELKHTLYSTSKSFTSTAVGFAVSEGKLALTDKVISFFPDLLPDSVSPNLAALTVKDVITMSDGQDPDPTFAIASSDSNWVKGFLALPFPQKPGSTFLYNSMGTFMLSAIVQKTTGQRVLDYLRPRLFDPLGISGEDWEQNLQGMNTGGWGLRLKTEDLARFGQLYLQKGAWNGRQILPKGWVEEATTAKIIQHPGLPQVKKDSSDWEQGYCYQFWRCRHNAFRADGAFGQYVIVMPEQDAVVAITAETPDMQEEINLVWRCLLPAMHRGKLAANPGAEGKLRNRLAALKIGEKTRPVSTSIVDAIAGKTWRLDSNARDIASMTLGFRDGVCHLQWQTAAGEYSFELGATDWKTAETNFPGPTLIPAKFENTSFLSPYKVAGRFFWRDEKTLEIQLRYIESPHAYRITCRFAGNTLSADWENSFDFGKRKTALTGTMEAN